MATDETQRIARLTPLDTVLARIDARVKPVAPRAVGLNAAAGRALAADVVAPPRPAAPIALRDGYSVKAEDTADAGSYAPAPFAAPPLRVDLGEVLPAGADAVAPLDAVVNRGGRFEAVAPVAPGDGVLAANGDIRADGPLRHAGERLRSADIAVLAAVGVAAVQVREPRIRLAGPPARRDPVLDAARGLIGQVVTAQGAVLCDECPELAAAFEAPGADAIIAIGGTGSGRKDASVATLARLGHVEVHGIALMPGETAAFGFAGSRPVLLVPGRLDAALAVWLTLGRRLLMRLSGCIEEEPATTALLARKIASPLGLAEVVPVRCRLGKAEPIASGYWPLQAITQADGWIFVPADSEGYPAATEVVVRPWP